MQGSLRNRLAFLLAAGGIGLCAYAGLQWRQLPHYSEQDLQASTELNLRLDLARQGRQMPQDPAEARNLLNNERTEVDEELRTQREAVLSWLAFGMASLVMAGSQFVFGWLRR